MVHPPKASVIECQSLFSINTLLTPWVILDQHIDQHSISILITTRLTLHQHLTQHCHKSQLIFPKIPCMNVFSCMIDVSNTESKLHVSCWCGVKGVHDTFKQHLIHFLFFLVTLGLKVNLSWRDIILLKDTCVSLLVKFAE